MFLHKHNPECPRKSMLIFAGVLCLDQLLKNIFLESGKFQKNYHALFGMEINIIFALAALCIFLFLVLPKEKNKPRREDYTLAIALILSGVISNMIDKIRLGFIIDYINFSNYFIFNIADLAILCGVGLLIWRIIKE